MNKRNFFIGALCDIGNVKKTNQDNILVKVGEGAHGEFGLFIVADGMGGLAEGDTASNIAVSEFEDWWDSRLITVILKGQNNIFDEIRDELYSVFIEVNKKIIVYGKQLGEKVGTTLSTLLVYENNYIVNHIGDSRIYIIQQNEIKQITEDHSWVAEQVKGGFITQGDAKHHPKRSILTQCLGVNEDIHLFEASGSLSANDVFLICSDGFYNFLDENEILSVLRENQIDNEEIIQLAVNKLLVRVKERGAYDNISAILVYPHEETEKRNIIRRLRSFFVS